ncbi:STAS domain-containing protein [Pseudonocardia parietis]|uniref:Anti-anti-sigma factor n=1 Tax=Pseudonocardia parietis TaxID=570936 RepID=A0ABS4W765_9PSEU|nr:STAS domain-containing protein [Pseudonocardia parietis]MBP2372057.1 anti-anti-sigma factor [Pseudonocardia parietis]
MTEVSARLTVVATRPDRCTTMVTVCGDVDLTTAPVLTTALRAMVVTPAGGHAVVDLNSVSFLAACGVEALTMARDHAATSGTTLVTTAAPDSAVGRALAVLGWVHDPGPEPGADSSAPVRATTPAAV